MENTEMEQKEFKGKDEYILNLAFSLFLLSPDGKDGLSTDGMHRHAGC